MKKNIIEEFDGYQDIVLEMEMSRKYGVDYTSDTHSADQYIRLLHPPRLRLQVADVIQETSSAKTFRLVSKDHYLPPFQAGQYIALFMEVAGIRTSRPYSISSPPNQLGYYDVTVKRVQDGLVSNYLLDHVSRGDSLMSSGPAGNFYVNPLFHHKSMVCLAGGSGITPFMSMIREIVECGLDREVCVLYGNRALDDALFHDMLRHISERFDNIRYIPVVENPPTGYDGRRGLITADVIESAVENVADRTFYLCGPKAMYDFCIPELECLGIPGRMIRREVYGPPLNIRDDPAWPQDIKAEDTFSVFLAGRPPLQAKAGESLLAALENGGVTIPSLCRSGECSLCRTRVLSGKVFQPGGVPVRKSDRQLGYVHACVSYPIEDLEIVI